VKVYAEGAIRHVTNVELLFVRTFAYLYATLVVERAVWTVTMFFGVLIVETKPIAEDATMAESTM